MQNSDVSTGRRDALLRGDSGPRVHAPGRIRRLPRLLRIAADATAAMGPLVGGTGAALLGAAMIGALKHL